MTARQCFGHGFSRGTEVLGVEAKYVHHSSGSSTFWNRTRNGQGHLVAITWLIGTDRLRDSAPMVSAASS